MHILISTLLFIFLPLTGIWLGGKLQGDNIYGALPLTGFVLGLLLAAIISNHLFLLIILLVIGAAYAKLAN